MRRISLCRDAIRTQAQSLITSDKTHIEQESASSQTEQSGEIEEWRRREERGVREDRTGEGERQNLSMMNCTVKCLIQAFRLLTVYPWFAPYTANRH